MDETKKVEFDVDSIKILEDIGVDEISKRTHIDVRYIKLIINSEFDKLNRVNALGFVKIISREFNVDLTQLSEEMQRYWSSNNIAEEANPKIFIAQKPRIFPKILMWLIYTVLLISILSGAYYFVYKKLDFFQGYLNKNDTNYTYEETPVVKEATQTLIEEKNDTLLKAYNNSSFEGGDMNISEDNISENIAYDANEEQNISNSLSDGIENQKKQEVVDNISDKNITTDTNISKKIVATIVPNVKLWVGVIYLDDDSRDSYLGEGNFSIDLSREQLITTGHGNFSIVINNVVQKFKSQAPKKFLVKDGKIEEISVEKFKELNRGNLW